MPALPTNCRNMSKPPAQAKKPQSQYNVGTTNYLNVASAERSWLNAELNLISTRQQIRISLARLCTALGGGWSSSPEETPQRPAN